MVNPRCIWLLVLWATLFASCREAPATQLLVVLDSDIPLGTSLQTVRVILTDRSGREVSSDQEFAVFRTQRPAGVTLPFSFGVVPIGGDASRRIRVIARASVISPTGGRDLVELTAITGFIEEKKLLLPMYLQRACVNVVECADGFTCIDGQCRSATRSPETLQEIPQSMGFDAAGVFEVASTDRSPPDVPSPDVPSPDVPSPDVPSPDVPSPDVPSPDVPSPDVPSPDVPSPDVQFTDAHDVTAEDAMPDVSEPTDLGGDVAMTDAAVPTDGVSDAGDPCSVPGACLVFPAPTLIAPLSGMFAASTRVRFKAVIAPTGGATATARLELCGATPCTGTVPMGTRFACVGLECAREEVLPVTSPSVMYWRMWVESPGRFPAVSASRWYFHPRRNARPARDTITNGTRSGAWGSSMDLNGDGLSEMVAGAPRGETGGVFVAFGNRAPMATLSASTVVVAPPSARRVTRPSGMTGYDWGHTVTSAGDMNGDGLEDLAVSSLDSAALLVYLGGTSFPDAMIEVSAMGPPSDYAAQMAGVGDLNSDGYSDLAVSHPSQGRVRVVLGSRSTSLSTIDLPDPGSTGDSLMTLAAVGDLNGDRRGDVIAGFPGTRRAVVWVSNSMIPDAFVVAQLTQPGAAGFGALVAGGSDVNGDGLADVAVVSNASVFVYLGLAFDDFNEEVRPLIAALPTCWNPMLGGAMIGVGDLENDGLDEIAIAQRGGCAGVYHFIESGRSLSFTRITGLGSTLGTSMAAAGDINGDGLRDVLVGDPNGMPLQSAIIMFGDTALWRTPTFTPRTVTVLPRSDLPGVLGFGDSVAGWSRSVNRARIRGT